MSKRNIASPLLTQNMKSKKQKVDHNSLSNFALIPSDEEGLQRNISGGCENSDFWSENYDFWQTVPPGFRFNPTEQELILAYLGKKVMNEQIKPNIITEVEVYKYNPEELSRQYRSCGEREWYFFSPRDRRYPNGNRPNRSTQDGYWKATGKFQFIHSFDGSIIGKWRTLVYYKGNHQQGRKTNWIMREYCLDGTTHVRTSSLDMKLDDWVLCRIYQNMKNYVSSSTQEVAHLISKTIESAHFNYSHVEMPQPQSQFQSNNIVMPSEMIMNPTHMNPHSSETSQQSSHLPSFKGIQDEMLNLDNDDDIWKFIDFDNLSTQDNVENDDQMTRDKVPSLVDITTSVRTSPEVESSRLIAEPSNNLYTRENVVNYHCKETAPKSSKSVLEDTINNKEATTQKDIASYKNDEAIIRGYESMHHFQFDHPSSGFKNPIDEYYYQNLYWSTI